MCSSDLYAFLIVHVHVHVHVSVHTCMFHVVSIEIYGDIISRIKKVLNHSA